MRKYLLFQLYGPLASWGDVAIGEERPTFHHPTKSAVIGMLAAARGIIRDDQETHRAFSEGYGFSVLLVRPGLLLRDYHTSQVPPQVALKSHPSATRRDELEALAAYGKESGKSIGTILSSREYRCDAFCVIGIWARDGAPCELEDLARALEQPKFVLYLGRKSCPPALPLSPKVIKALTLRRAFLDADFPVFEELPESVPGLFWEEGVESGMEWQEIVTRRDHALSRKRWQFEERVEYYAPWGEEVRSCS